MTDLIESFEREKREIAWKTAMEAVIKENEKSKCIVCFNEKCTCTPNGCTQWDQPWYGADGI